MEQTMSNKRDKRKPRKRAPEPGIVRSEGGRVTTPKGAQLRRRLLPPGAPTASALRRLYRDLAEEVDEGYGLVALDALPASLSELAEIGPDHIVEAHVAWAGLVELHTSLLEQVERVASTRGSAEWLWWLRRLRGQFHLNTFDTTDPYVQVLAETLVAGTSRASSPVVRDTYEYPITPEVLLDLIVLRNYALAIYRLQATMKRCAKGQNVYFVEGDIPQAETSEPLESAIRQYDLRVQQSGGSLLDAVGLHAGPLDQPSTKQGSGFGGLIPFWALTPTKRPKEFIDDADPSPCLLATLDLNAIDPFVRTQNLTKVHVALIAVLHAAWKIIASEPEHQRRRSQAAIQWGYMVTPTDAFLRPALDETLRWMFDHPDQAIPTASIPADSKEVFAVLSALRPSMLPPYCGSPLHHAYPYTIVDLTGASHRLWETLARPVDGAGANLWSQQFEADVQDLVDRSLWRPEAEFRNLIGRTIRRPDGTALTDIDAIGMRGNDLLVLSCKSVAIGPDHMGGNHAAVRNFRQKSEKAAQEWMSVVEELRTNPSLLGDIDPGYSVHGLVVCPAVPFVVTQELLDPVSLLGTPYVISSSELHDALASSDD